MARSGTNHKGGQPHRGDRTLYASRIPTPVADRYDEQIEELGISRTEAIARILTWADREGIRIADLPHVYEANRVRPEGLPLTG